MFLVNMPVLVVAIGTTLVMLAGEIDISVGSVFADLQRRGRRRREGTVLPIPATGARRVRGRRGARRA